jgi:hypothetical protein
LLDSAYEIVPDRASTFCASLASRPATNPSVSVNLDVRAGCVVDLSQEPVEGVGRFAGHAHNSAR